jgi:hypothetical protein
MNLDKIISQLESKETLLIFLRDNFPDVLEKWKNKIAGLPGQQDDSKEATKPKDKLGHDYRDK